MMMLIAVELLFILVLLCESALMLLRLWKAQKSLLELAQWQKDKVLGKH